MAGGMIKLEQSGTGLLLSLDKGKVVIWLSDSELRKLYNKLSKWFEISGVR